MEEFRSPEDFPSYGVNILGEVRNLETDRIISPRPTRGNPKGSSAQITLTNWDHRPKTMSLARLVAEMWLPEPALPHYDTPINLNGDRFDCRAENLMWRPRWYAIQYHQQFYNDPSVGMGTIPVMNMMTEEVYENVDVAFMKLGLIRIKTVIAIHNQEVIRPDNILLRWVKE